MGRKAFSGPPLSRVNLPLPPTPGSESQHARGGKPAIGEERTGAAFGKGVLYEITATGAPRSRSSHKNGKVNIRLRDSNSKMGGGGGQPKGLRPISHDARGACLGRKKTKKKNKLRDGGKDQPVRNDPRKDGARKANKIKRSCAEGPRRTRNCRS